MTQDHTYIYYDKKDANITQTKITTPETNKRLYHYDSTPDTGLTGILMSANNARHITLYQGIDAMELPITEIISVDAVADGANIFLPFDSHTFGNTDANRLLIGLEQEGTNTPIITDINFFGTMLAFPDGFFDKIVPIRADRGGGVIELADGSLVQYEGFGGEKWRWTLSAKFVNKPMLDRLDTLYSARPEFFFAQEPARYPDRIHRCILESPIFRVPYTSQWKENGYSIELQIAEV